MRIFDNKKEIGFSLIETIIAISLSLLVTTMILLIVFPGLQQLRSVRDTRILHLNASFVSNKFNYWIKQGNIITVSTPSTLEIYLPDSSIKTITKNGDNIITIDGNALTTNDIEVIDLTFTKMSRSVKISFTLRVKGTNETFSVITTVAQRNIL